MSEEETERELAALEAAEIERGVFRECYQGESGINMLAWEMNDAGCFSMQSEKVDPVRVAAVNRKLGKLGIIHVANLLAIAEALLSVANDEDIAARRRQLNEEREGT